MVLARESSRSFYSYKVLELRQRLAQQPSPQELAAEVEASRIGTWSSSHRGKLVKVGLVKMGQLTLNPQR